ncbi:MAG: tetratricopeptide repeat protein, partial [Planctomycetota bacterium]
FDKYGLTVELALPITEFVVAHIRPCRRGVLLGLAEAYQAQDRVRDALDCLKKLRREMPDDVVVNLSIAELLTEAYPHNKRLAKQIVQLAGDVDNESSVHAGLMLYKAQALRTLGLFTAARDVLTPALRMTKNYPANVSGNYPSRGIPCQRSVRELVTREPKSCNLWKTWRVHLVRA